MIETITRFSAATGIELEYIICGGCIMNMDLYPYNQILANTESVCTHSLSSRCAGVFSASPWSSGTRPA